MDIEALKNVLATTIETDQYYERELKLGLNINL